MTNKPVKINRYYGLRVVSTIYKLLAVLTVLIVIGGTGYLSLAASTSPFGDAQDFYWWLPRALSLVVGGGLLAFTFFVLAQLVDIQLSMNNKMREMVNQNEQLLKAVNTSNKLLESQIEQMGLSLDNQARLVRLQNEQSTPQKAQTKVIGS
jgi:hypothetical protein